MNEMKMLEDFCAVVPSPDQDRLRGIRAAMLTDDQPAGRRRGWAARLQLTPIRLAGSALLAGGTAAALVVASAGSAAGPAGPTPASVAQLLQRAAAAALTLPVAADNQFIYTEAVGPAAVLYRSGSHVTNGPVVTETQQKWASVDNSKPGAMYMTKPCAVLMAGGQPGPPLTYAACHPTIGAGSDFESGLRNYAAWQKLPTDPAALLNYIKNYYAKGYAQAARSWTPPPQAPGSPFPITEPQWDWMQISVDIALTGVLPPQVGAAVFKALALLPGVYLVQHVTDYAGKPGIAVAMKYGGNQVNEVIFDPGSYKLTGTQSVIDNRVGQAYALVKTAIVNTAPPGSASFAY
jgi:hypothetical protein